MELVRTEGDVNELLNKVADKINEGSSRFRGMTYEEGVRDALMWAIGDQDEYPYPES